MNLLPGRKHNLFNGLFDDMLPMFHHNPLDEEFFSPSVDIEAQDDHYVITADIPGVKKNDISLSLENGVLTLSAQKVESKDEKKKGKLIRQERRTGSFARSFSVGSHIQENDISATFSDGVLTITVPRLHDAEPTTHQIKIK